MKPESTQHAVPLPDCPPHSLPVPPPPHPPLIGISTGRDSGTRLKGAATAVCGLVLLSLAAWLTPDPRGAGTHRGLGLPPCGFLLTTRLPCPTCGMTSAYAEMMHGRPLRALAAQPLGALLCLATFAAVLLGAWSAATGRRLVVDWYRVTPTGLALAIGGTILVAWGVKIVIGLASGALPLDAAVR